MGETRNSDVFYQSTGRWRNLFRIARMWLVQACLSHCSGDEPHGATTRPGSFVSRMQGQGFLARPLSRIINTDYPSSSSSLPRSQTLNILFLLYPYSSDDQTFFPSPATHGPTAARPPLFHTKLNLAHTPYDALDDDAPKSFPPPSASQSMRKNTPCAAVGP